VFLYEPNARRHAQQIAKGGFTVRVIRELGNVTGGRIVQRMDLAFLQREADGETRERLGHRMGDQLVARSAFVFIALDQHTAVFRDQKTAYALPLEIIVDRIALSVEGVTERRLQRAALEHGWRVALREHMMRHDRIEMAERADAHALVVEPVAAIADRIA